MEINAEAIHGTRPWKVFGEGPTQVAAGAFQESAAYTAQDIRFTTKGEALYAITLGEPKQSVAITSLGRSAGLERRKVKRVELLGRRGPCVFRQADGALQIDLPASLPTRHASAFKITFA
jgi:alpha-L-fucosidase